LVGHIEAQQLASLSSFVGWISASSCTYSASLSTVFFTEALAGVETFTCGETASLSCKGGMGLSPQNTILSFGYAVCRVYFDFCGASSFETIAV